MSYFISVLELIYKAFVWYSLRHYVVLEKKFKLTILILLILETSAKVEENSAEHEQHRLVWNNHGWSSLGLFRKFKFFFFLHVFVLIFVIYMIECQLSIHKTKCPKRTFKFDRKKTKTKLKKSCSMYKCNVSHQQ